MLGVKSCVVAANHRGLWMEEETYGDDHKTCHADQESIVGLFPKCLFFQKQASDLGSNPSRTIGVEKASKVSKPLRLQPLVLTGYGA